MVLNKAPGVIGEEDAYNRVDYQWESTDSEQGEKLADEWINAGLSKLLLELATRVSTLSVLLTCVQHSLVDTFIHIG